jgi:hypothetical protein
MSDFFSNPEPDSESFFSDGDEKTPKKKAKVDDDLSTRLGGNIREAWLSTPLGRALNVPSKPVYERDPKKREEAQKKYEEEMRNYLAQRKAEKDTYEKEIPNWYQTDDEGSLIKDLPQRVAKLATSGLGQVIGAASDPGNLVMPSGAGKTALQTFAKGAFPNAGYAAATEQSNQLGDVELGLQDEVDQGAVIASALAGGTLGGTMQVGQHHVHFRPRTENIGPSGEALDPKAEAARIQAEKVKARAEQMAAEKAAKEGMVDGEEFFSQSKQKAAPDDAYPEIMDEFQVTEPIDTAAAPLDNNAPADTFPDISTAVEPRRSFNEPAGEDAFANAMWELRNDKRVKSYPKLAKEFQTDEPTTVRPTDEPFPEIDNGFGPDVTPSDLPLRGNQAGVMPGGLVDEANFDGMAGSHKLDLVDFHGTLDPHAATKQSSEVSAATAMGAARTLKDALNVVVTYGQNAVDRVLAKAILAKGLEDVPFRVNWDLEHAGVTLGRTSGSRDVEINPKNGGDSSTVLHEAVHVYTNDAIHAVEAGKPTVDQAAYVKRLQKLYDVAKKWVEENGRTGSLIDEAFRNLKEFNAYGLTDPQFRDLMAQIPFRGVTLWERFIKAVAEFFGTKDSVMKGLLELSQEWDRIQAKDAQTRGEHVFDRHLAKIMKEEEKDFHKAITDPIGMNKKTADAFADKLAAHHGFFETPKELVAHLRSSAIKDLPLTTRGLVIMQNQLAMIMDKNPVISFVFNYLRTGLEKSEKRMLEYNKITEDIIKWGEKNPKETVSFFRELIHLNAKPEFRELRAQLEEGGPQAIKQHFVSKGVDEATVDRFLPMLAVMKDVLMSDRNSLRSAGRGLDHEPLYFPLARNGPYHFVLTDGEGLVRFAGGYQTLADAKKAFKIFKESMPQNEGWTLSEVERTDPSKILNDAMTAALTSDGPDWLKKAAANSYSKRAEYKRKFELGRNKGFEVGGYLGEVAPKLDEEFQEMAEQMLKAFAHRVRESHHLENASRAMELINELLIDPTIMQDPVTGKDYEGTKMWMHNVLSRHLGLDIASGPFKASGDALQTFANKIGRAVTKVDGLVKGYEVGPNDNVIRPDAVKAVFQGFSFFTSLVKIGLVPHVLAANLVQNVTISADGVRNAARLGVPIDHAIKAQALQAAYIAAKALPAEARPESFKHFDALMKEAKDEGILDPHGREDYSTVENVADRSANLEGMSAIVQAPRNAIEKLTNYNAVLYYHFFVDSAFPSLDAGAKKRVVYNLARSFTGDYSQPANLFLFDKAGDFGHLGSNFARWRFNRTSRYIDDLAMLSRTGEFGVRGGLIPLLTSMATGLAFAGAMGAVGLVEYEAIRRLGAKYDLWDIRPLSKVISDILPENLSKSQRTFFERGMFTALSDATAQKFGQESGPDISGSIREASMLEVPGVAVAYGIDAAIAAGLLVKRTASTDMVQEYIKNMSDGPMKTAAKKLTEKASYGFTNEETRQFIKAMPVFTQEAMKYYADAGVNKIETEEGTKYVIPEQKKDTGNIVRNEFQQTLAMWGGLKTTKENRELEGKQVHKWEERDAEKKLTALKQGLIDNINNPRILDQNINMIRQEYGEASVQRVLRDFKKEKEELMQGDYFTLETLFASRVRDPVALQKAIDRLESALRVARPDDKQYLREGTTKELNLRALIEGPADDPRPAKGLADLNRKYPTLGAALKDNPTFEADMPDDLGGFVSKEEGQDAIYMNRRKPKRAEFVALHEGEHILAKKGFPADKSNSLMKTYDKIVGDKDGWDRRAMVHSLASKGVQEYLRDKYGITDAYFDMRMVDYQGSRAKNLLEEQFASLSAAEQMAGPEVDLTKDPFLRKHVFNTKERRMAFRALTGLRQTRLDSKDLPPHTAVDTENPVKPRKDYSKDPLNLEDDQILQWLKRKLSRS